MLEMMIFTPWHLIGLLVVLLWLLSLQSRKNWGNAQYWKNEFDHADSELGDWEDGVIRLDTGFQSCVLRAKSFGGSE